MGISSHNLCYLMSLPIDYSRTATIGRQKLRSSYDKYLDEHQNWYGCDSWDISSYQGATKLWDFNNPLPPDHPTYTAVIESGTLEHIYNIPQALRNIIDMVEVEGHIIGFIPADKYLDHGLYQIQPRLIIEVFSRKNGWKMQECSIMNKGWKRKKLVRFYAKKVRDVEKISCYQRFS